MLSLNYSEEYKQNVIGNFWKELSRIVHNVNASFQDY